MSCTRARQKGGGGGARDASAGFDGAGWEGGGLGAGDSVRGVRDCVEGRVEPKLAAGAGTRACDVIEA